jgi:hypothetical protein
MQKIIHTGRETQQLQGDNDIAKQWHFLGLSVTLKIFVLNKYEPSMTLVYRTKYKCNP